MHTKNTLSAYSPATVMLDALRNREISATELLEAHLSRGERFEPLLNSIVVPDYERARLTAKEADARRAKGDDAPLLGLPVTVKESIDVEGLPTTAGVAFRVGHRAKVDAPAVARLRAAGAVILGKTNVCTWLQDYQADNPIYGRTNNPWNLQLTSGGSSGGSATLAAGLTALDLGSDLGGSIRVPAAFCGLWGHKPSQGIIPNTGHFPGFEHGNPAAPLATQGVHARSPDDLELAMKVICGPDAANSAGWSLNLPPARHPSLAGFRVAVLPAQPWLPVHPEILTALENVTKEIGRAGATVTEISPSGLGNLREHYAIFRSMMCATISSRWPKEHREKSAAEKMGRGEEFHAADARGLLATAGEFLLWHAQREAYRSAWREFFRDYDVLLTPMTLTPAFEHTSVPNADRRLRIEGRDVEFEYMSFYPSIPTLAGQPATAFPAGFTSKGLPVGLQAVGPILEDWTPIRFASLLERAQGGFQPPPDFDAKLS